MPTRSAAAFGAVLATTLLSLPADAAAAALTVTITDVKSDSGVIRLCVFDEKNSKTGSFPDCASGSPVKTAEATISGGKATVTFKDLPNGVYAISLFHDENGDGRITMKTVLGIESPIPREGIGISNNPKLTGKPDFGQASFIVSGDAVVQVRMKYL
jgi:uncharacterized protein (DUF2141 family)